MNYSTNAVHDEFVEEKKWKILQKKKKVFIETNSVVEEKYLISFAARSQ